MEWVADVVENANEELREDRHAAIGPSYFMKDNLDRAAVERIWSHSVFPYVEECLFGDRDRIGQFKLDTLIGANETDGSADAESDDNSVADSLNDDA